MILSNHQHTRGTSTEAQSRAGDSWWLPPSILPINTLHHWGSNPCSKILLQIFYYSKGLFGNIKLTWKTFQGQKCLKLRVNLSKFWGKFDIFPQIYALFCRILSWQALTHFLKSRSIKFATYMLKKNCTIGKGRLPLFLQEGQQPDLHGGVDSLGGSRNGPLSTAAAQPWLAGLQGLGRRDDVHNAHLPLSNWRCFGILHGAALVHCRLAISPHTGAEGAVMVPRYLFTTRTVERVVMKNFFQRA